MLIHLVASFSIHIAEWIEKGEVDVGLIYYPNAGAAIRTERILQEEMFLVCPVNIAPEAKGVLLAALGEFNMILPRRHDGLRAMLEEHEERSQVRLKVSCEVDSSSAALVLVADWFGYSIIPHPFAAAAEQAGGAAMVRLFDTSFVRDIYIAWSKAAPLSLGVRELARQIRLHAHELMQQGIWHGCTIVD